MVIYILVIFMMDKTEMTEEVIEGMVEIGKNVDRTVQAVAVATLVEMIVIVVSKIRF